MELERGASPKEVKLAFLNLAKKYHPDVCEDKEDTEHFKQIVKAYEILKDSKKRKIYDLSLSDSRFNDESFDHHHYGQS